MNPFTTPESATRYALGRHDYSPFAIDAIEKLLPDGFMARRAIDIGAGTGISSNAIKPFTEGIVVTDASEPMLQHVSGDDAALTGVAAMAESMPFVAESFDLIAVGSAIHWFDRPAFLAEIDRIATEDASLLIHNHGWTAHLEGSPDFTTWARNTYLERYPTPDRDRSYDGSTDLGTWKHRATEHYVHQVLMTASQLVDYLVTQSNVQVVLNAGTESEDSAREWLQEESLHFVAHGPGRFTFRGFVALHTRAA